MSLSDTQIAAAVDDALSTVGDRLALRSFPSGPPGPSRWPSSPIVDRLTRVDGGGLHPPTGLRSGKPIEALEDRKPLDLIARRQVPRVARIVSSSSRWARSDRNVTLDGDAADASG